MRTKSQPVPRGITASSPAVAARDPVGDLVDGAVAADDDEQLAPSSAASRASSARWPGRSEKSASPSSPGVAAAVGELRPALAGRAVVGRRVDEEDDSVGVRSVLAVIGRERELGHLVDGRAQLLVGDALELALDDDVADGEEAAGRDRRAARRA